MPLLPLQLPAGVYRNGTDYQAAGRWLDSHLVRWIDNTIRPVGGWRLFSTDAGADPLRGAHAWKDNSNGLYLAAGSASNLYAYSEDGTIADITPVGLTAGRVNADSSRGFGKGNYGEYTYGTARIDNSSVIPATTWALDNWGEYLVACSNADGKLYEWQLDRITPTPAAQIANAPVDNRGLVVTEERFIFALGAGGNPRKVQWCDREDNTTWTPDATNEAGDIELQTVGNIEAGYRVRGQTLILTDQDAHIATYLGAPYVYGIERVGNACGIISKKAGAVAEGGCIWMGLRNFYMYTGGAVQEIPSDVDDYVFRNINRDQQSKVCAVANKQFNEIWWFYPTGDSLENDAYVVYNYKENIWFTGYMGRTTGVDSGVFNDPVYWCSATNRPFSHETGFDYGNLDAPWAETGAISLGAGDQVMKVVRMIPDERTQGDVTVSFKTRFHPNDTERTYGSYTMANPTSMRFTGRQIKLRIEGARLADWRVGTNRLEVVPGGKR